MREQEFTFPSATGVCRISASAYLPDGEAKNVLVIHHGMAEHRERYAGWIRFLCDGGTAVYMHDMASHGRSVCKNGETGWFGEEDGWQKLVEDFRTLVLRAREEQPGKPLTLMGHSMGSFLCRLYAARFPEDKPAGAIFMGTGGANSAAGAGLMAARTIAALRGKHHKSKMLNSMAFGTYNKRFEGRTDFDWLTRDTEIVDRYVADPLCGFLFTVQGMADLVSANIASNAKNWYETLPAALPVLLVSGEEDPVGDYGRGVKDVADGLRETGHTNVTVKLYPGCRHEVLNETNRQQVMEDVRDWIDAL